MRIGGAVKGSLTNLLLLPAIVIFLAYVIFRAGGQLIFGEKLAAETLADS